MVRLLLFSFFLLAFFNAADAQNLTGQWKGEFYDKSSKFGSWGGNKCEYVVDLEIKGKEVTGYSYTYFTDGAKRYYTICKLEGFIDKQKKYVEIKEFERTKTNVPVEVGNCFQIHKLTYFKKSDGEESLEGNWIPAPKQQGNCGYGISTLTRRNLRVAIPGFKNPVSTPARSLAATSKRSPLTPPDKTKPAIVKNAPVVVRPKSVQINSPKKDSNHSQIAGVAPTISRPLPPLLPSVLGVRYEKRGTNIIKTIEIQSESVRVDLYDSGEIDGDSVSLFLNGNLMVARKRLTTKPLTIRLPLEELNDENELVMYADNLGSIPPNTALMVVTDGTRRYEVRITSDLQKSGTIKFVKKHQLN